MATVKLSLASTKLLTSSSIKRTTRRNLSEKMLDITGQGLESHSKLKFFAQGPDLTNDP